VGLSALTIEGLALFLAARRLCRTDGTLAQRLVGMAVVAGTGAAVLQVLDPIAMSIERSLRLADLIGMRRWSLVIPSVGTSGVYFMLVAFLALAEALGRRSSRGYRAWAWIATASAAGAVWLTRTRTAIVTGAAVILGLVVWGWLLRRTRAGERDLARGLVLSATVAFSVAMVAVFVNPFGLIPSGAERALGLRLASSTTALRMTAAHPWFGVGVGQFALNRPDFMSADMNTLFPASDAHNQFLGIAAELGIVGFAAFILMLASAAVVLARRSLAVPADRWLLVVTAGLASFVVTWAAGNPMLIPQAGLTFWIVAGAALGVADPTPGTPAASRTLRRVAWAAAAILLVSLPVRAIRGLDEVDRSRVAYGFYGWEVRDSGDRYRWSQGRATLFARSSARRIELPVAAWRPPGTPDATLEVFVDGRLASHLVLTQNEGRVLQLDAPPTEAPFWRIDLVTTPTWTPEQHIPGSDDRRQLGVAVGETTVLVERPDSGPVN
jgi:O-antigen ligase